MEQQGPTPNGSRLLSVFQSVLHPQKAWQERKTAKRAVELTEIREELGDDAVLMLFKDLEDNKTLDKFAFSRSATGYDVAKWVNRNIATNYSRFTLMDKSKNILRSLPLNKSLDDVLGDASVTKCIVKCATRKFEVNGFISAFIKRFPTDFPGAIQYNVTDKTRMRVAIETTPLAEAFGDFVSHVKVYVQPILSEEELKGRSQPWLAFDIVQHHFVPILRTSTYATPRTIDYLFETKRKFSLREVGELAASAVRGKFHFHVNNCMKWALRFLKKLGLERESRGMFLAANYGTRRGLRSRWYKHRNPFTEKHPEIAEQFDNLSTTASLKCQFPPICMLARMAACRKIRGWHLGCSEGGTEGDAIS